MILLKRRVSLEELKKIEEKNYFDYMSKAVVDIRKGKIAVNGELHSDLKQLMLDSGSDQHDLYGINILFEEAEIEFDSLINPPRNREAGYPRVGRYVANPEARSRIEEIVRKWIEL